MKKLLVFLVMLGVMASLVMATENDFYETVDGVVSFDVSGDVTFTNLVPGASNAQIYDLIIRAENTVSLEVDVYIDAISVDPDFFKNVELVESEDLDGILSGLDSSTSLPLESESHIPISITDPDLDLASVEHSVTLGATLTVPAGALPGLRTAKITYMVTSPPPEP